MAYIPQDQFWKISWQRMHSPRMDEQEPRYVMANILIKLCHSHTKDDICRYKFWYYLLHFSMYESESESESDDDDDDDDDNADKQQSFEESLCDLLFKTLSWTLTFHEWNVLYSSF